MKIVSAAAEYGNGHAFIDIGMPVVAGMKVTIERDAEKNCFLGPAGWQNSPTGIPSIDQADGANPGSLLLGPHVVDALKDGDFITISVLGTSFSESDFWPPIPISGRKARGEGLIAPLAPATAKPASGFPSRPGAQHGTGVQPAVQSLFNAAANPGEPAVQGSVMAALDSTPVPFTKRLPGGLAILALAVILLVGAGFVAWRYWPEGSLDVLQTRVESTADGIRDYVSSFSAPPPTDWAVVLRDPNSTPEALYQSALDTREGADTRDLSRELLYQSALRGNTQALKDYSRLYDPTVAQATGWDAQKNARTALEYYRKLQTGGDRAAVDDIRRVCDFLRPNVYTSVESRTAFDDFCS